MHYKEIAKHVYKKFSDLEGNQHIAADYALEIILRLITDFKFDKVLEIGLGIGSISDTVLEFSRKKNSPITYFGTEKNEFCLNALRRNVTDFKRIHLYSSISAIPKSEKFNFVVIDGSDSSLVEIKTLLSKHPILFVEGGRRPQINLIKQIYPNALESEVVSIRKPPEYGPFHQKWTGSGHIIFCEPTMYQKLYWFVEKVKSYTKRRIRKFLLN